VIVRQRPGTAKGVLFISLEDETGISNIVVMPDFFDEFRREILTNSWLMFEGKMQNVDGVVHVMASRVVALENPLEIGIPAHNFH
jgi:error-prone DNA polymerase